MNSLSTSIMASGRSIQDLKIPNSRQLKGQNELYTYNKVSLLSRQRFSILLENRKPVSDSSNLLIT